VCGPKIGSREGASLIAKHIPHGLWRPPEGKQSQDVEADELYDLFECIKPSDRRPAPFWVPELNRRSIEPLVTIALGSAQRRSKKDLDASLATPAILEPDHEKNHCSRRLGSGHCIY
jgi:hypothetical protein